MRVLGIDPGMRVTGYGVVEVLRRNNQGTHIELVEAGIIRANSKNGVAPRLEKIYSALTEITQELKPDVIVIEKLYAHYRHPVTAILMGHARGIVCLVSGLAKIPLVNLASTHVKKSVTGHGHAGKNQIQRMVQHYLRLKDVPRPPDVADALAVAISYVFSQKDVKIG